MLLRLPRPEDVIVSALSKKSGTEKDQTGEDD